MSATQAQPKPSRATRTGSTDLSTKQRIAVYWVRSETVEGREYKVRCTFRLDRWECDCPASASAQTQRVRRLAD